MHVKWKKARYNKLLYDSIYVTFWKRQKINQRFSGAGGEGNLKKLFEVIEIFHYLENSTDDPMASICQYL